MKRIALVLIALIALIAGSTAHSRTTAGLCGTRSSATYSHVVTIVFENHGYSTIVGKSAAPYINSLISQCGLATNYFGVTHPSLPNYLAMTGGTTAGVTDDKAPSAHKLTNSSIFQQVGSSWKSYEESMPSNCDLSNAGTYAVRHNPAAYYTNIRTQCQANDVPLPSSPSFSAKYTMIKPNLCNDMTQCSVTAGDNWLKALVPKITSSAEYQAGTLAIFITWDEGGGSTGTNQVANVVVSPTTPAGTKVSTKFNHYSMLRTQEEILSLPCLASACSAASMKSGFHL